MNSFLSFIIISLTVFWFNPFLMVSTVKGDNTCTQGGIGPSDLISHGAMNHKYMWFRRGKKYYVPIVLSYGYSPKETKVILGGLKEIEEKTCIEFDVYEDEDQAKEKEKDYVYINKNGRGGCYSYIGRRGGKQNLGLPPGCITHGITMHEILHALGFRHEHVRYDRDDYVKVFFENIVKGRENNFVKKRRNSFVNGPYDYHSIMHYRRKSFSKNGKDTIQPLKKGANIGVRKMLSHWDAAKVNVVYKCGEEYCSKSDVETVLTYSPTLARSEYINDTSSFGFDDEDDGNAVASSYGDEETFDFHHDADIEADGTNGHNSDYGNHDSILEIENSDYKHEDLHDDF